ncbi:MAG: hypothetical protein J7539_04050 [Niabella sp.]|nr:hypothetical protein [Niabella sp.]
MKKTLLAIGATFIIGSTTLFAQNITLKFNPANGSSYLNTTGAAMKINQTVMGQTMEIKSTSNTDLTYKIADAAPDKNLEITYNKINMTMDAMGQSMNFDSESTDSTNQGSKAFRAVKGSKVTALIGSDGTVKSVKGADAIAAKASSGNEQTKELLNRLFSENALKSSFEQLFKFYPNQPVKQGSTWTATTKIASPYAMTLQNNYTLVQTDGGKSTLKVDGKASTDGTVKFEQQGMSMDISLNGTSTGTMLVDNNSGMPDNTDITQHLKGTIKAMGQEIPIEITIESKSSIKKQ